MPTILTLRDAPRTHHDTRFQSQTCSAYGIAAGPPGSLSPASHAGTSSRQGRRARTDRLLPLVLLAEPCVQLRDQPTMSLTTRSLASSSLRRARMSEGARATAASGSPAARQLRVGAEVHSRSGANCLREGRPPWGRWSTDRPASSEPPIKKIARELSPGPEPVGQRHSDGSAAGLQAGARQEVVDRRA